MTNQITTHLSGALASQADLVSPADDLSLSEIAENIGISRQGARQAIKKGEEELLLLESKLGLANRHLALKQVAGTLLSLASSLEKESENESIRSLSRAARACAEEILSENQN